MNILRRNFLKIFSKDVYKFIIVGFSTVLIDYIFYLILINTNLISINTCKTLSFIIGTLYAYFANKIFTFQSKSLFRDSVFKFFSLYLFSLLINVLINAILLNNLSKYALQLAFLISTFFSASINFLGMKYFVFRKN